MRKIVRVSGEVEVQRVSWLLGTNVNVVEVMEEKDLRFESSVMLTRDSLMHTLKSLVAANFKIEAIKLLRQYQGLGLKEAKDFVDSLREIEDTEE